MTLNLKKEWFYLAQHFSDDLYLIEQLWEEVEAQYTLKIRHYHNLSHLEHMFNHAKPVKSKIHNWHNFLFAIWYHDVIYKPTKKDNEEKSAILAKKRVKQLHLNEKHLKMIENLIISTKKHQIISSQNTDNAYLLDIDLSILGTSWDTYQKYIQNIRKEYAVYPNFIYNKGRKKVLQHFLERETLYFTEVFQNKFETQAKENLTKEIKLL